MDDAFNISKQELITSLDDGFDLRRNAAEYIIAWESLSKSPTDSLLITLKNTAESILKVDEEEEFDAGIKDWTEKPAKEGEGLLLATKPTKADLTNHHWKDGLLGAKDIHHTHAVWPTYQADIHTSYKNHHFPYHEKAHPLRRINAHSGRSNFVETLRAHSIGGHSEDEKKMEAAYHTHLLKNASPVLFGLGKGKNKTSVLGSLKVNGVNDYHQEDLYNRDYQRWLKDNEHLTAQWQKEGKSKIEIANRLRDRHFEDRADDWESNSYSEEDANGEKHPHGLGLDGFMYGLEWFTPEERTAVMRHMHEKGLDDHSTITLPNGEKIATGRIAYNNVLRRTPEMNYMTRKGNVRGRNEHYRLESNEEDFKGGENRFIQRALGTLAHSPIKDGDHPISQYILDALNNHYGIDAEDESSEKELKYIPRLGLHGKKIKKNYTFQQLKSASERHFKKGTPESAHQTRLPMEDILFLAGYDPKTREPMLDHPIYGEMDGPIVPMEDIDLLEKEAKLAGTHEQQGKRMRNELAFLQSPHGPHPDSEPAPYWREDPQGFTYGPGEFWDRNYKGRGGVGLPHSTWAELNHSISFNEDIMDEDQDVPKFARGGKEPMNPFNVTESTQRVKPKKIDKQFPLTSSMFNIEGARENAISPNPINNILGMHFSPEQSNHIGYFDHNTRKYVFNNPYQNLQNILSPVNVSKKLNAGDGKHNYTAHASSLNPQYNDAIKDLTTAEKRDIGSHNKHMHETNTYNPMIRSVPESNYGTGASDSVMHNNIKTAHTLATFLGRLHDPNKPAKKSVASLTDLKSNNIPISTGLDNEDLLDILGMGTTIKPNYKNLRKRFIKNRPDAQSIRLLTAISKAAKTTNPNLILKFIDDMEESPNNENYQALMGIKAKQEKSANGEVNWNWDKPTLNKWIDGLRESLHREKIESKTKKNKAIDVHEKIDLEEMRYKDKSKLTTKSAEAIQVALSFGGMLPAMEKEEQLTDKLNSLEELLQHADPENPLPPEQVMQIRQEINEGSIALGKIQDASMQKVLGKIKGSWAEKDPKDNLLLMKAHRQSVAERAKQLLPMIMENDPEHFNPENPQQFIYNTQKLLHDVDINLGHDHSDNHGLITTQYRLNDEIKEQKPSNLHERLRDYFIEDNGFGLDGNMDADTVMAGLGMGHSEDHINKKMREHVQRLIEESSLRELPLEVATIGQILQSGIMDKNINTDILRPSEELASKSQDEMTNHEKLTNDITEHGINGAIERAQQRPLDDGGKWKSHLIHRLPQQAHHLLGSQKRGAMLSNGLQLYDAGDIDVHNRAGLQASGAGKGKKEVTARTKNYLDSIVSLDPGKISEDFSTPTQEQIRTAGMHPTPVGPVNPVNTSLHATFGTGDVIHHGTIAKPTFGIETDIDGNPVVGNYTEAGLYHSVPEEVMSMVHGPEITKQVLGAVGEIPHPNPEMAQLGLNTNTWLSPSEDESSIAMSEISEYITSLLNPDLLLTKSDDATWSPAIRPMHRIFELSDLEQLRGFSGSWVVSKWYDGKRVIIVQNDNEITTYDENGRKVGLKKAFKESLQQLNDNNFTIDGIIGEEDLNIIDILNYDDTNVADMLLHERMKILRGQFDSHENVIVPGPHDTKMTDDEGLEDAVDKLQEEHQILLLRDNKSTYMKGERRHPKWLLLRKSRDFNFIVLDKRGKGPYTYQLGAGPILDGTEIGNRAITYKNQDYMDVGTAHNQQRLFKVGDIVRASITGITKKKRGERDIFNVQVKEIESEGEGEGPASTESLDLITKTFKPILIPHDIDYNGKILKILLNEVDSVSYNITREDDNWYIHDPVSALGDLCKTNYSLVLAESLQPYWQSVAPLMLEGYLKKFADTDYNQPVKEDEEEDSAGILEEDDDNRLLKPTTKKALEIITRALDQLAKEKLTWTGPKGLGIDMATPIESPHGPTQLTEESNLPDYDGDKPPKSEPKGKKPIKHIEMDTNADEHIVFDENEEGPVLSV